MFLNILFINIRNQNGIEIFFKVNELPVELESNALYFVKSSTAGAMEVYMSNAAGTAARKVTGEAEVTAAINAAIAAYDLQGASKLAEEFTLSLKGAATGSVGIDGSGNVDLTVTLADSGVTEGDYGIVSVNGKGLVTGGRSIAAIDLPADITSNTSGKAATAGNADSADKVNAVLTINGEAFDGSAAKTFNLVTAAEKGAVNGVAQLDAAGKVPAAQLPSYVDDVVEVADYDVLPLEGEEGKIYVTLDNGNVYRWSGSSYVRINDAVSSAEQATKLATARTISLTGDATGSVSFNGTQNVDIEATLKSVGTAGAQGGIVTTDAQGRVVSSRALELSDLPSGITSTGVDFAGTPEW